MAYPYILSSDPSENGLIPLKRFYFVIPLLMLAACGGDDYSTKNLSSGLKGGIDYVRDAFGQPITRVSKDDPQGPFPAVPTDPRPEVRSEKERNALIADLNADHATATRIQAAVDKSDDKTRYVAFNGAPPTAQPIALAVESVSLPDGVKDMDTIDKTRIGSYSEVAEIEFKEGSAELPDGLDQKLAKAASLAKANLDARIVGYSSSDRLTMPGKGPHEANRWLADLRARKVARELLQLGVAPAKLVVGSASEAERKSGDKVEIIIDY